MISTSFTAAASEIPVENESSTSILIGSGFCPRYSRSLAAISVPREAAKAATVARAARADSERARVPRERHSCPGIRWGSNFHTDAKETTNLFFLSGNSYTIFRQLYGGPQKRELLDRVTSRRGLSPRSQQRQHSTTRMPKEQGPVPGRRGQKCPYVDEYGRPMQTCGKGKDKNTGAVVWRTTCSRCHKDKDAAQAAHAGSIRVQSCISHKKEMLLVTKAMWSGMMKMTGSVSATSLTMEVTLAPIAMLSGMRNSGLGNANRSLTMGIGCWSPLSTSSTTRKRYAGSARRRWML
jgi:hypothetical protein